MRRTVFSTMRTWTAKSSDRYERSAARNFIVAPNHSSHLDTGLVKKALGDAGKNMAALAANDYFFDTNLKRAFFDIFTNLIPMERQGSMHESLKLAIQALHQGYNLLIFPEGTRSKSGKMADFKFSLGYLALRSRRGILPDASARHLRRNAQRKERAQARKTESGDWSISGLRRAWKPSPPVCKKTTPTGW